MCVPRGVLPGSVTRNRHTSKLTLGEARGNDPKRILCRLFPKRFLTNSYSPGNHGSIETVYLPNSQVLLSHPYGLGCILHGGAILLDSLFRSRRISS